MRSNELVFPDLYRVDQSFEENGIKEIRKESTRLLNDSGYRAKVKTGQSLAVCVASRGTHDLKDIVLATVEHLKASRLKPFITPAMGSHGGPPVKDRLQF